jgi:hypothetical protein
VRRRLADGGAFGLDGPGAGFLVGALVLSVALGDLAAKPAALRIAILVAGATAVIGLAFLTPQGLLLTLAGWLVALGLLRRVVSLGAGTTATDPLLLIAPFAFTALLLVAVQAGAFNRLGMLAKAVLALNVLTILGALNPAEGSIRAGLAGLLFVLVPTLAFWIGRALVDDRTLRRLFLVVAGLAVPAAIYGLWQTFGGFPSWDRRWIDTSGFAALNVGHTVRPFSTFSSASEYGFYLAIAIAIWIAFSSTLPRLLVGIAAVGLLGAGLLYEASRTVTVLLVAAVGIAIAARSGVRAPAALGVGAAAVVALSLVAGQFAGSGSADTSAALLSHETRGLADPFDSQSSTALGHFSLVFDGMRSALTTPAGHGVASVTIAGSKFGGVSQSTEADPSNAAVALGLPGLLAYLVVLATGLALAYRTAAERRDALGMAALAIVLATLLEWLNGGQYAVAFLPWLVFGWADGRRARAAGGAS